MRRVLALGVGLAVLLPVLAVVVMFGALASLAGGSCQDGTTLVASGPASAANVPSRLMSLYVGAAGKYGLGSDGWSVLAAINYVETDFGADLSTSSAGAVGWMQFMPATWAQYGVTPSGAPAPDGPSGWNDPADAIYSAANYLQASGAPGDWNDAIFTYNKAGWYVSEVESDAALYRSGANGQTTVYVGATSTATATAGASATTTTGTTVVEGAGSSATGGVDQKSAVSYVNGLSGVKAGVAVVTASGQVLAQHNGNLQVPGASITKAMLLVAYLEQLGNRPVPLAAQAELEPMIEISDNAAGSWTFAQVGAAGVEAAANQAGMTHFVLDTSDPEYTLGQSLVTALDFARFFARVDQLMPATNRAYGMGLLESISSGDRWGILDANVGVTASKAGWKTESDGWVVNQAGQLQAQGQSAGLAVVSEGSTSLAAGESIMQTVASDLLPAGQATAASGGQCAAVNGPSTPGATAAISANGLAEIPQGAPTAVQQMIAAGNEIITYPYSYGGGHDPQSMRVPPGPTGGGYDCSSSVDFLLWGAGLGQSLLAGDAPASGALETVGDPGPGQWVTIYANPDHAFIAVDGLVMDTAGQQRIPAGSGPRWQPYADVQYELSYGSYTTRHPQGL